MVKDVAGQQDIPIVTIPLGKVFFTCQNSNVVEPAIQLDCLDCRRVDVICRDSRGTSRGGGNGSNAGARTEIHNPFSSHNLPMVQNEAGEGLPARPGKCPIRTRPMPREELRFASPKGRSVIQRRALFEEVELQFRAKRRGSDTCVGFNVPKVDWG